MTKFQVFKVFMVPTYFLKPKFPVFSMFLRLNSRYFCSNQLTCWMVRWKQKVYRWGFPQITHLYSNATCLLTTNVYISKHSSVCCQSPGMILMRYLNGRCPENMLELVQIESRSMVAAIIFNLCGRYVCVISKQRCLQSEKQWKQLICVPDAFRSLSWSLQGLC